MPPLVENKAKLRDLWRAHGTQEHEFLGKAIEQQLIALLPPRVSKMNHYRTVIFEVRTSRTTPRLDKLHGARLFPDPSFKYSWTNDKMGSEFVLLP